MRLSTLFVPLATLAAATIMSSFSAEAATDPKGPTITNTVYFDIEVRRTTLLPARSSTRSRSWCLDDVES